MERRTALAIATAAAGTVLATGSAFAANLGLLGREDPPVLSVVDAGAVPDPLLADPTVVTLVVEDPPVPQADRPAATGGSSSAIVAPAGMDPSDDGNVDGHDDSSVDDEVDGEHEDEIEHEDEHEDEVEHEDGHDEDDD